MKKNLKNLSLLYNYILIFSSLALICCITIGLFSAYSEISRSKKQKTEYRQNLLNIVSDNIDKQYDLMEECALKISVDYHFNPTFYDNRAMYELELINLLEKYSSISPIASKLFLIFEDSQSVFLPGSKNRLSSFADAFLGLEHSGELHQQIFADDSPSTIILEDSTNDSLLFVFPIFFQNYNAHINACICYSSSMSLMQQHIANISGISSGWQLGGCIDSSITENLLSTQTESGLYITLDNNSSEMTPYFADINHLIFILISAMCLFFAMLFAYKVYAPLSELTSKFNQNIDSENQNELYIISSHIDKLQLQNNNIAIRLNSYQHTIDQQQLLMLLLNGLHPENDLPLFSHLKGKNHVVCTIQTSPSELAQKLLSPIDELSSNSTSFLTVFVHYYNCAAVLVSSYNSGNLSDAPSMIRELLNALEINFSLSSSPVFNEAEQIQSAFFQTYAATDANRRINITDTINSRDILEYLSDTIQNSNRSEAEKHIETFFSQVQQLPDNFQLKQLLFNSLFIRLYEMYSIMHLPHDLSHLSILHGVSDTATLYSDALYHVEKLCQSNREHDMLSNILNYIDNHFTEYDFDQNTTAEHFGISISNLYRIIKNGTGNNFIHYLTNVRIQRAKELLENGTTVTDTSIQTGYSSVSFFIRTFKKVTGYTPANYRTLKRQNKNQGEQLL